MTIKLVTISRMNNKIKLVNFVPPPSFTLMSSITLHLHFKELDEKATGGKTDCFVFVFNFLGTIRPLPDIPA
jgi:hypothetical protein